MIKSVSVILSFVLMVAGNVFPSCADDPENLVPACGFETQAEVEQWLDYYGTATLNVEVIRSGLGAVRQASEGSGSYYRTWLISDCIPTGAITETNVGGYVTLEAGSEPVICHANVMMYLLSSECTDIAEAADPPLVEATAGAWGKMLTTAGPSWGSTFSSKATFYCESSAPFVVTMDDAFFGPGVVPAELQSMTVD